MSGRLFGLGLGPGDPELLTLKAHRLLRAAEVIVYPLARAGVSFARAIAAPHLPGGQREIAIAIEMSTDRAPGQGAYDAAAIEIAHELDAGRDVAVLCEGDPFFYGSFLHLFARLSGRYETAIVPGISSIMAGAAAIRRPLSARQDTVVILPATLPDEALRARIEAHESVAILKLGRHFARVKALIAAMGLTTQAVYAERVSLPDERILPLAETDDAAPYFALVLLYRGTEPAVLGAIEAAEPGP